MKKVFVILYVLMIFSEATSATDTSFQKANGLYQDGNYELALNAYQEVIDGGFESSDLYYNMGNAAYRSNSIGLAILYYEKALKLNPSHDDARHNLIFVSRYRVDTFEEVPQLFLKTWSQLLVKSMSERTWSILSLSLFILLIGSILYLSILKQVYTKKSRDFSAHLQDYY